MASAFQVAVASRRDQTLPHRESDGGSKSISQPVKPAPQFINVVNPFSRDKTSQTQVRAQVMRDYHRRRIEKEKEKEMEKEEKTIYPAPVPTEPTSASKGQKQKFRLKGEKGFRPWVPVKSVKKAPKKQNTNATGTDSRRRSQRNSNDHNEQIQDHYLFSNDAWNDDFYAAEGFEDSDWISTRHTTDTFATNLEVINQYLSRLDESLRKAVLYHSPSAGAVDPFGAMALLIDSRTEHLLHHYFDGRLESWLMMPMRKGLFSLAVHDTAMFHTFLTHYVASYNARFKIADTTESLHHRTMAIKIVNKRLSDPTRLPSDGTIAAVANLAAYECSNGTSESALVHLNGLEQMVNMRGGLYGGDFPPHVQRLLGWTDFHCANALLQRPRFLPLTIPITAEPTQSPTTRDHAPSWTSSFSAAPTSEPVHNDTDTIDSLLNGIQSLSDTLRRLRRRSTLPQEDIWYSDRLYHLQRQLAEIIYSPSDTSTYVDSARAIAALMYCAHCFRDVSFSYSSMVKSVTRLKTALELAETQDTKNDDDDPDHPERRNEEIFWTLALGGVASEGKPEREWYVDRFRRCCDELGLIDWQDARALIGRSPWHDELDSDGLRLWTAATE